MQRDLTVASELVPFQEIEVFARESGYIDKLYVDYGSRVRASQVLATLEIPELAMQLDQDRAVAQSASQAVVNAQSQVSRVEAQHQVLHLQDQRQRP